MENVQTKHSVHDLVTDQIIELLEQGIVPWQTSFADSEVPANLLTKRQYRGINVLLLAAQEYECNYFLTESQIERIGACVREGQKPHVVIDGVGFRSLCPYEVYNVSQCADVPKKIIPRLLLSKNEPIEIFKGILSKLDHCPRLVHNPEPPYYLPSEDAIHMPPIDCIGPHEYYALFYKQLISMTQHQLRLDRTALAEYYSFDAEAHALEALIVEIASWYLRCVTKIEIKMHFEPYYIQYWIRHFKKNPELVFTAAYRAQEAVEYVMGIPFNMAEAVDWVQDEMLPF